MTKWSHSMYDQAKRAYMHGLTNSSQSVTSPSMSVVTFRSSIQIIYQAEVLVVSVLCNASPVCSEGMSSQSSQL